jgi:hypothetical protein
MTSCGGNWRCQPLLPEVDDESGDSLNYLLLIGVLQVVKTVLVYSNQIVRSV